MLPVSTQSRRTTDLSRFASCKCHVRGMTAPPTDVVSIVAVGLGGAATLTVVYGTGPRLPRFTTRRLVIALAGFSILTVPLPLLIYYARGTGRNLGLIVVALFVISVVVLGLVTPDDDDGMY